jgi:regulator of sirC expression with transglutaminase-like and TPR domain
MPNQLNPSEVDSLINLLDDPDETIYKPVVARLRKYGRSVMPVLETAAAETDNALRKKRLQRLTEDIHINSVIADFTHWCEAGYFNIVEILSILARYESRNLKQRDVMEKLEILVYSLKEEISIYATPLQQVKAINHVLFTVHRFRPDISNAFNPKNNLIDQVLQRKTGSDIILGLIYMHVAGQLGFSIKPVNFPRNLLLAYEEKNKFKEEDEEIEGITFYINPFNKGAVLTKNDIRQFLIQNKMPLKSSFFEPSDMPAVIQRLLRYMTAAYTKTGEMQKVEDINQLLNILNSFFNL